jgi:Ca2+-binding RTX toxin-like protein
MGDDNDYSDSGSVRHYINGQQGADRIILDGLSSDTVYGGSGGDTIDGGFGGDTIFGQSGEDLIFGSAGGDLISGGSDDDILNGDNDAIEFSEHGIDTMFGGSGDDTLIGGGKADIMSGGTGNDNFVYRIGLGAGNESAVGAADHITDFQVGDHIDVSAIDAESFSDGADHGAAGMLLFASYPASNMSDFVPPVLSISASNDGLATPEKINASKTDLPPDTTFTVVQGAVHANFGDYGPQPGDGQPTISADSARRQITAASLAFVQSLSR